jgi:hypothetical protein
MQLANMANIACDAEIYTAKPGLRPVGDLLKAFNLSGSDAKSPLALDTPFAYAKVVEVNPSLESSVSKPSSASTAPLKERNDSFQ